MLLNVIKPKYIISFLIVLLFVLIVGCGTGGDSEKKETSNEKKVYTCKIAFSTPPDLSGAHAALIFADQLEKKSEGKIKPELYPQGQLGSDPELMNKLEMGAIQVMNTGGMMLSNWTA